MNNLAKGALIGSGAAAAALCSLGLLSSSISHTIVKVTLDRSFDMSVGVKMKKLLSGCDQMDYIEYICKKNSKRLLGGDCRTVSIRAVDGERLVGHLHIAKNAKRTVIAMHGWRTSWASDFGTASEFFHSNDCNVLYAEQRGHGNSGGTHMGFGIIERYDCLSWINFINSVNRFSSLPIYLCGVSMGASTILMATGFKLPSNVVGVIADCGFTSPQAVWGHVTRKNLHMPYHSLISRSVRNTCIKKMKLDPDEYSTVMAMKTCKIPILFIHGACDRFVPIDMTYENYSACRSEKRLFIVPTAEHGMSYFTDQAGYEAEVLKLFRDCDIRV